MRRMIGGACGWVRRNLSVAFAVALIVFGGLGTAFATPPASCTALETPATATISNAFSCLVDTVDPTTTLVNVVALIVPIMLIIWGARGGFALAATVVRRIFGFMTGRA